GRIPPSIFLVRSQPAPVHGDRMPLISAGVIAIPGATGSAFDHAAFDARTRRVFVAHTARDCVEVIDDESGAHIASLPGFAGAADDGALVEVDAGSGDVTDVWPIAGAPDVTFFNPASGLVHVAIGEPGLVHSIDPRTGGSVETMTAAGAHTTALVAPDRLYVI